MKKIMSQSSLTFIGASLASIFWIMIVSVPGYFAYLRFSIRFSWFSLSWLDVFIILLVLRLVIVSLIPNRAKS